MTEDTGESVYEESVRVERLLDAQAKAAALFAEVEARELIVPGKGERAVSDEVRDLAGEMFGVHRFWHKRIIRSGPHTLHPYAENPPDRVIEADDIVFADFGPLFEEWEADFGRTYVLGRDPVKHRLCADLPTIFEAGRAVFEADPEITGEQLYAHVVVIARDAGWEFGGAHSGHLVGEFPHEKINGDQIEWYLTPGSTKPLRRTDRAGRRCHWILEIHLVDRERRIGGFYEELLDLR